MQNRKIRILHLLESGGMYGAENVVINLSRETLSSGLYEPIIGCITQYPEQKVELAEVAKRFGIESRKFVINNITLPVGLIKFSKILKRSFVRNLIPFLYFFSPKFPYFFLFQFLPAFKCKMFS